MPTKHARHRVLMISLAILLASGACKNPFQSGLGDKVDIDRPIVTLDSPDPGDFLRGVVTFSGKASDDTSVSSVRITFDRGNSWTEVDSYSASTRQWSHTIDTLASDGGGEPAFPNGRLNVRVRVIDNSGKQTTTEELLFTVDNEGPRIFVLVPTFDEDDSAVVALGGIIAGTVTDAEGVETDYPQIKFWPAADPEPSDTEWETPEIETNVGNTKADFTYSLAGLVEGQYFMRLRARDLSGQQSFLPPIEDPLLPPPHFTVTLVPGQGPPSVSGFQFGPDPETVNSVGGNNYAATDFTFSVTATDSQELEAVSIERNGIAVLDSDADVALSIDWSGDPQDRADLLLQQSVGGAVGLADGVYEYRIRATNALTLQAEIVRTVVVDTTLPEVEITNLRPTVVDDSDPGDIIERVNGVIRVNVAAGDENGLNGAKWWLLPAVDPAPTDFEDGGTLFSSTPYAVDIDTTGYADGAYVYYVGALDRAGNQRIISRAITVDQSSDNPTADFTDIDPSVTEESSAGVGGVNLLGTNARIRGIIEDDDRVDPDTLRIRLNGADWIDVETVGPAGRTVSFSHNVDSLGDGVHSFELEFSDDPAAKLGADPPTASATVGPVWFAIDTAPPAVSISSPAMGSFHGGPFTLAGTASDANGLERHDFGGSTGLNGYVDIETPADPGNWSRVAVDTGTGQWVYQVGDATALFDGAFEGTQTVSVRARDRFGKQTTTALAFSVDTEPPAVAITAPLETDWLSGASATVQGSAADPGSAVAQVRVWVGNAGAEPPAEVSEWTQAVGTSSWNTSVNLLELGEGRKVAHVRALDAAGNWSGVSNREFGIDQSEPSMSETVIGSPMVARNEVFSIGGTIGDTNALAWLIVTQRRGSDDPVEILRQEGLSGTSQGWSVSQLPRDPDAADPTEETALLTDGAYVYQVTVGDAAGKSVSLLREVRVDLVGPEVSITSPADGAAVQGSALLITGTAADVEDVSAIAQVRYWDAPEGEAVPADYNDWMTAAGGANWSTTLDLGAGEEGARTLSVVALDAAGNWSEDIAAVGFVVDQAPPTLSGFAFDDGTVNTVAGNHYAGADFGFSVSAADSNSLANVVISRNGAPVFDTDYNSTSELVHFSETVGGAGIDDGVYEYQITATDVVGKTAALTRSVVVDSTPPLLELNSLNPLVHVAGEDYVNSTIRFTVSASDDNGLTGVRWWLLPATDPLPDFDDPAGTSFGAAPYVALADTTAFVDQDEHILYVIARDRAGNDSVISRDFTIDQSTDVPLVAVTHPAPDAYVDAGYLVRGTVSDDDAVDPASVEVRYHDGAAWSAWQPASVTGSGREVTFSYQLPPGLGADGAKQVQARAGDLASAKFGGDAAASGTSDEVGFTLDTLAPVLSIIDPLQNATFREEFSLSGEVIEVNLETVRVSINGAAPVAASVNGVNETRDWLFDIEAAQFVLLDEGPVTVAVEAIDRVGRNHLLQRVVYKDTTGPLISFSTIVEGDNTILTESTPTVRGSFSDEFSDVAGSFEYRLNPSNDTDPWQSDGVLTGSGKNVNWSVPVEALEDGSHSIDLRVADALGNSSSLEAVAFRIDRAAPEISVAEPPAGSVYSGVVSGTVFTLSGSATDANLVAVTARLDGGPLEDVIVGEIENGVAQWTFEVTQDDFAPLVEGPQSISITAVDAAGRISEATWGFVKDSEAPQIFINTLEADGSTVLMEASPRVQGSASDDHGVSLVESRIERFNYASSEWQSYNRNTSGWDSAAPLEDQEYWGELSISANQNVVTWTERLGSDGLDLADGRYRIALRAYDGAQPQANRQLTGFTVFHIDRFNPALSLDSGASFQNADFPLSGTASDLNSVVSVRAKVGDADFSFGTVAEATTSNGYASWTVEVPTGGLAQGPHTVYVQAEDGAGRTSTLTREFTLDGIEPTISINEPVNQTRVNGLVTVRGTSDDDNAVALVQYRIGNNATTWQTAGLGGGLYSWNYTFSNINTYANTADVTEVNPTTGDPEPGTNVWALPFQVRVTDVAGNVSEELDYRLFVDPDMDAPQVTIVSPTNDQIVGGSVRVSGFASDDDWVRRVEIRIDPTGSGTAYEPWQDATLVSQGTQVNWFHNINTAGELNPDPGTIRDVRVQVRAIDSKDFGLTDGIPGDISEINVKFDSGVPSIEDIEIVRNGEITPYAPGVRASGTFLVRATVKDEGGIASIRWRGEGETFSEILNDPLITTTPAEISAGSFEADRKYLITSIGSTDFTAVGASSNTVGISFTATGPGSGTGSAFEASGPAGQPDQQFFVYTVELEIDSETVNGGAYAATSGFYSLDIQATDNATPTPYLTQAGLNIQIDNFFPFGEYSSSPNAATANYFIQGRAWDVGDGSGSIQGIDRVVVYFYRNGEYLNLTGGVFNATTRVVRDMTAGGALQTVPFPAVDGVDGIVINNNEVTTDLDGNGYIEGWTDDGIYKNWYVIFDTNQLPDGPLDLNYVVIDRAGNATRYVQPLYIRNNAPLITGVVLGTDIDGDGDIGDIVSGESRLISANYETTGFTVRNNRLSFTIEAESGNPPRRYSVGYVTSADPVAADVLLRGTVYTIDTAGDTNWTLVGAPNNSSGTTFVATGAGQGSGTATGYALVEQNSLLTDSDLMITDFSGIPDSVEANGARFVIKVYDTTVSGGDEADQLADAVLIGMNIDNIDNVAPSITLSPFGRRYTVPDSNRDQDKFLLDVDQYSDNIVTSGAGFSLQRHGYVQYAEHSANGRPDLSGRVILLGKAADNQRIARITAQIEGFDPDGAGPLAAGDEFDIAVWDSGGLVSAGGLTVADVAAGDSDWGFDIVDGSQAITEANGHVLNWRFAWNTAAIEDVARLDVPVTLRVYDFGPGDGNDNQDTIDVDVVPYITRIETPQSNLGGLKATNIRASDGEYSVRSGAVNGFSDSFITVRGFNLNPIADGVRIAPETTPSGLDGLSLTGIALSYNAPDTGFTTLTLSNDSTVSGYLGIVSGTPAAPVAAINNINDNSVDYNQEPDEFVRRNRLFTDDRFLRFFQVTETGIANANYPNMVMDGDDPYFGYIQSGADFDLQVRRGFSGADNTPMVRTLAGDQMAMVRDDGGRYHMISVTNFGGGRMHYFFHEFATLYQGANGRDGGGNNGASQPYWAGFGGANTSFTAQAGNNAIDLDSTSYDPGPQLGRYQRPVIRTRGDSTTAEGAAIYLAVFDSFSGELIFRNWRVGNNLTGGTVDLFGTYRSTLADRTGTSGDATRQIVTAGGNASEYFDMIVRDDGVVVLGYYNPSISRFTVRFSATTDGGTTPQPIDGLNPATPVLWSAPFVLPNEFVGWFPSMTLHTDNSLHIAAYDSGGANLTYIHMDAIDATSAEVVTVDNYGSVGYYNDLKIHNGVPWVAYYSISETGTRDSVKLARFNGTLPDIAAGVDEQGFVTGDWTTMTIPVASVPRGNQSQFLRVNLGFDTAGVPVVSHTGAGIEYVQPLAEN